MYGFSRFYKYTLPLLILSLWLVAVFLLSEQPANSQHPAISKQRKIPINLFSKKNNALNTDRKRP